MGMALCMPVNSPILCIHTHAKQGCGFHALADTNSTITKVGVAHEERVLALLHFPITYSLILCRICRSDLDNFQTRSDPDDLDKNVTWLTSSSFNADLHHAKVNKVKDWI